MIQYAATAVDQLGSPVHVRAVDEGTCWWPAWDMSVATTLPPFKAGRQARSRCVSSEPLGEDGSTFAQKSRSMLDKRKGTERKKAPAGVHPATPYVMARDP